MQIKDKFTLPLPLIQAPLTGYPAQPTFVSRVSECGALGVYTTELQTLEAIKADIKAIQKNTKKPFAVLIDLAESETDIDLADRSSTNTYLNAAYKALDIKPTEAKPFPDVNSVCKAVVGLKPPVLSFQNGIPTDAFIEHCQKMGIVTLGLAGNVLEAIAIDHAPMDGIILQGTESAGIRSTFENDLDTSHFPVGTLLHHAQKHTQKPLMVWGDCQTPTAARAMLESGAKAVVLDVPFWTVDESPIPSAYREALHEHNEMATVVCSIWHGAPAQVIKNKLSHFETHEHGKVLAPGKQQRLLAPIIKAAIAKNNGDYMPLWAGLCAQPSDIDLVALCRQYKDALSTLKRSE